MKNCQNLNGHIFVKNRVIKPVFIILLDKYPLYMKTKSRAFYIYWYFHSETNKIQQKMPIFPGVAPFYNYRMYLKFVKLLGQIEIINHFKNEPSIWNFTIFFDFFQNANSKICNICENTHFVINIKNKSLFVMQ